MKSYIENDDRGIKTLYVDDKPFFCYSGEIHNSSASSLEYMETNVWPNLRSLNMNSVIVPLYWELLEKEEGIYDYSLVDGIIDQARNEKMRLVFLWFGLWKNAESMYVPGWMKTDPEKYFRVRKVNGEPINSISPLCDAAVDKDAAAFSKLMKHIREYDEDQGTVIAIQVENEIGLLGTDRDYGDVANKAFDDKMPEKICECLNKKGNWKDSGEDAGENFMAYYFARAVEKITAAGQKEYPLPCYANAWLKQYPWAPGTYPSGGPVKDVHNIWKTVATSLFALAPDIYVSYCADVIDEYSYDENPLFIPEIRKDAVASSYCLYSFLEKNALCFSPFGIEDLVLDPDKIDKPPIDVMIALNIDPSAFEIEGSKDYLAATYDLLHQLEPLYLKYRNTDNLKCVIRHSDSDFGSLLRFSEYDVRVAYAPKASAKPLGTAGIFELDENTFLVVGMMCDITFFPKPGENKKVEFISLEEGRISGGEWEGKRVLNGDEKMSVRLSDMPGAYMIKLFKY